MGVPTSEVGYTIATTRRENHESSYEHVVVLEKKKTLKREVSVSLTGHLDRHRATELLLIQVYGLDSIT